MRSLTLAVVTSLFLIAAGSAQAAPVADGVFDLPAPASQMALGPDGNVWVTLDSADPDIARVAPDGTVTPFTTGKFNFPHGITVGPDGNMWITQINNVGKFPVANPLGAEITPVAAISAPNRIVTGPDGNLWTASQTNVVKIPPANPAGFTSIPTGILNFDCPGNSRRY